MAGTALYPRIAAPSSAKGAEVLLVDQDERVRSGFRRLLSATGVLVTAVDSGDKAIQWARDKFFSVAVIDVDTPEPGAGIALMSQIKQDSQHTAVVLLTSTQTFDTAAEGFRAGAADVVVKAPENVKYLTDAVTRYCAAEIQANMRAQLLKRVLETHEQFLERLMAQSRRALVAEEKAAGLTSNPALDVCRVLVVDDNPRNGAGLQQALGPNSGFLIVSATSGGSALDRSGSEQFQIALVKDTLPDLPSGMVVSGIKAELPDGLVLLFSPPGDKPGRVDLIETSGPIPLIGKLERGEQFVAALHELRDAYVAKKRERHYLRAFREEHIDFLRKYVELKQKLSSMIEQEAKERR